MDVRRSRTDGHRHWRDAIARRADPAWIGLIALLVLGLALRVSLFEASDPAFIGFPDSFAYAQSVKEGIFNGAASTSIYHRPAGYPVFLSAVHDLSRDLAFVVTFQHLLGMATAVLLFLGVRRAVPAGWGLLPAAVVLLAGPQLFLEHAPMSEALFGFLLAVMIYAAIRAAETPGWRWEVLVGLSATAAGTVRLIGLPLLGVVALWLLIVARDSWRGRLRVVGVVLVAGCLVYGAYIVEMSRSTAFDGPTLTDGGPYTAALKPLGSDGFLGRIGPDLVRLWSSEANFTNGGIGYPGLASSLVDTDQAELAHLQLALYPTVLVTQDDGPLDALQTWERRTRLEGLPFVVLLLLAVGGLALARGQPLTTGTLMLAVAFVVIFLSLASAQFDARYVVPAYGPLAGAGAIGAATLWRRLSERRAGRPQAVAAASG